MLIYWLELRKLLSSLAVWGFIAVCLLYNIYLVTSYSGDPYADFVGTVSKDTGDTLGQSFNEKLSQFSASGEQRGYLEQLRADTHHVIDVFEDYETKGIGESYILAGGATGRFAEAIRDKYLALQKVVDVKAANDESLTLYFGESTYNQHQKLFNGLTGWLIVEGALISVLMVFLSVGYENNQKTGAVVYSTRVGRRILRTKMTSSLSAGIGVYALLALCTFLIYFLLNDYKGIWGSSVSSVFNYRFDVFAGHRPFVTWYSFNVFTYFLAMLGMSAGVIVCLSLTAICVGVFIRNHYIGFMVFLAINAAFIVFPMQIPQTMTESLYVKYYSMLSPVWLWLKHSLWFTDGDSDILWPHFESLGLCVSLIVLIALCLLALIYFRKRDLT
ncbi:hypothetical protein ACK8P5_04625 [Paenibacillus sp. EC2-1]|uniref:hypothetical protein n=1 Tax=Paenibacillus sp. EC2-1 TaxID=3388665 RepID=UPI003BEF1978